jgi:hypothetical protein
MAWPIIEKMFGGAAVDLVKAAGNGVGNVLDRFVPKKMSESEKFDKVLEAGRQDLEAGRLEVADVNSAREMWMTFLRTQKVPWAAAFLNAVYRPVAGFVALAYLTDSFWAQVLTQLIDGFAWVPIKRDPVVDGLVAVIIYFFFGYRQRSKEKGVAAVN